ncbi:unnamed protein product, partial [Cylindrotheca closterium]
PVSHVTHVMDLQLIIIDVTASKLGELSRLFSESRGKPDEYFGGIPVLLVGAFNQKEPVGGILATTTLMKKVQNEQATLQQHHTASNTTKQRQYRSSTSLLNANVHNTASDSSLGSSILSASRWFELTVAERSKDMKHNENIDKLYDGMQIHLDKFHIYEFYNDKNLMADTAEERLMWLKAPVIVKTNRKRCTINYSRGLQFAKATNAVLVRWNLDYSKWEGKPPNLSDIEDTIDRDAAFWEIFVSGGPCYLIDTISKERKLCNGTRAFSCSQPGTNGFLQDADT